MRITKWDKQSIVTAIMSDVPKPDKAKRRTELQEAVVKLMSPALRKIYKATPKALAEYHVGDLISDNGYYHDNRRIICADVTEKQIKELVKKYEQEDQAISDAKRKLKGVIDACTSLKQLNDRLPEFKKYFPTEDKPSANLPAIANMSAELSKLGWPKGAAK
jgi:L-2-hydroxyglutarate oxidase LhgO